MLERNVSGSRKSPFTQLTEQDIEALKKTKAKPTKEEANFLIDASRRIAWQREDVPCPRCGKLLAYTEIGNSYTVACSDDECISIGCRGI